jgi:hypothetical protein
MVVVYTVVVLFIVVAYVITYGLYMVQDAEKTRYNVSLVCKKWFIDTKGRQKDLLERGSIILLLFIWSPKHVKI